MKTVKTYSLELVLIVIAMGAIAYGLGLVSW